MSSHPTTELLIPAAPLFLNVASARDNKGNALHLHFDDDDRDDDDDTGTVSTAQSEPSVLDQPPSPMFGQAVRQTSVVRKRRNGLEVLQLILGKNLIGGASPDDDAATCGCTRRRRSSHTSTTTSISVTDDSPQVKQVEPPPFACPEPRHRNTCKLVRFQSVQVRLYEQTLGDNPSVAYGPPISLSWEYRSLDPVSLDDFEAQRAGKRRHHHRLTMSHFARASLLSGKYGFDPETLERAAAEARRVQRQRAITRWLLPVQPVEDVVRSMSRKVEHKVRASRSHRTPLTS